MLLQARCRWHAKCHSLAPPAYRPRQIFINVAILQSRGVAKPVGRSKILTTHSQLALAGHGACSIPLVPVAIWNWGTNVCFLILYSTLHCEWCGSLPHPCLSGHHCLLPLCPLEILTHPSAKETKVRGLSQTEFAHA